MATIESAFTPEVADYARKLSTAGFTVYAAAERGHLAESWFHYSTSVDGVERFGTYSTDGFDGPNHSMPIKPSRLNGSSATVGAQWGDDATLGLDDTPADSIEYARIVARARNYCPFNAEPTEAAVKRANGMQGVPQKYYRGATLANATPWGIGDRYLPVGA